MSISIFAKRHSRARRDGHLQRVSSIIRGQQVAEYLHAKINPEDGFENDVCIYVKPHVKPHEDFEFHGHPYLDIIDGWGLFSLIQKHPEVTVITCSAIDFEYVSENTKNKVILIPQHHCNFELLKRTRNEVTKVGCIGTAAAFQFLPPNLKEHLSKKGIELVEYSSFHSRQDIINFYLSVDVQIVWRPYFQKMRVRMSNPLKLVNAAAFGVPTIALDEPAFAEMNGTYIPVKTLDEFLFHLSILKESPTLYGHYSQKCLKKAELYHISQIGRLYLDLV